MGTSDIIAQFIREALEDQGEVELKRNEIASRFGCVPSQINYVITTRFNKEHGYIVESRRGGGGYIRITRVDMDTDTRLMQIINSIGPQIDQQSTRVFISNLIANNYISAHDGKLMWAALNNKAYGCIPQKLRDTLRAELFKSMLIQLVDH